MSIKQKQKKLIIKKFTEIPTNSEIILKKLLRLILAIIRTYKVGCIVIIYTTLYI